MRRCLLRGINSVCQLGIPLVDYKDVMILLSFYHCGPSISMAINLSGLVAGISLILRLCRCQFPFLTQLSRLVVIACTLLVTRGQ